MTCSVGSFDTLCSRILHVYRTMKPEFTMTAICSVGSHEIRGRSRFPSVHRTVNANVLCPRAICCIVCHVVRACSGCQHVYLLHLLNFWCCIPKGHLSYIFHCLSFRHRWGFVWDLTVVWQCLFEALISWKLWYLPDPFRRKILKKYPHVCANSVVERRVFVDILRACHPCSFASSGSSFLFCSTPVSVKAQCLP